MDDQQQDILALCLQPVCTPETFFKEYFLKKPLHTRLPNNQNRFERKFRLSDLEFLWNNTMKVDPQSMLFFHQQTHPDGPITALRSAFYAFAHQISVVVNKADKFSPSILGICNAFEKHFPFVFCNVYSTPAGERTVPVHVDDRDVFVLQVHGAKHWTVYENPPIVLPYKSEELGKHQPNSPTNFDESKETVAFDDVVQAGDVLYLPRGFAHVAKAIAESPSVHLTIAVQTSDWDVNAVLQDGFESAMNELLRKSAVSGTVEKRPEEFILREVLPPSLLAQQQQNQEQEQENFVSKLQTSLQLVSNHLTQNLTKLCLDQFNSRLAQKRIARKQFFDENIASLRFFPLTVNAMIQWCSRVKIVQIIPLRSSEVPNPSSLIGNISHAIVVQRKIPASASNNNRDCDTMQLKVSSSILEVMLLWQEHYSECPSTVAEIASILSKNYIMQEQKQKKLLNLKNIDFSLAAICTVGMLLRNGCMIRIS